MSNCKLVYSVCDFLEKNMAGRKRSNYQLNNYVK